MLKLYMDHHVQRAITQGLRARGVDVITAYEDGHDLVPDSVLLDRASALGRVLFSQDDDFLVEARERQQQGMPFGGVVYGHQHRVTIGTCINDLELILKASSLDDVQNHLIYLPF